MSLGAALAKFHEFWNVACLIILSFPCDLFLNPCLTPRCMGKGFRVVVMTFLHSAGENSI